MFNRFGLALSLLLAMMAAQASVPAVFDTGFSKFSVRVNGLDIGYREFAVFVMPGEKIPLTVEHPSTGFQALTDAGGLQYLAAGSWRWTAPTRPGHYSIDIRRADGAELRLQVFVMVPANDIHHGRLNGYRIGHYPTHTLDDLAIYRPPAGFVEVTPRLEQVHVSPHFTLGEFLCKQSSGYPKYLVLRPQLLLKLEALTAYLDAHGIPPSALHIMSGYRTPWYNARLGNVAYSRHMWGDAADIYIDASSTGADVRGAASSDRVNYMNSSVLAKDANRLFHEPEYAYLQGGIGVYPATDTHPPFMHVDARGFRARWGNL
jgi:Peptidase M15